jgi:hypothetical protein
MATRRAEAARLDAEERRERQSRERRRFGSADGGKGAAPSPGIAWGPDGPNEHTPRH